MSAPVSPQLEYKKRLHERQAAVDQHERRHRAVGTLRLIAGLDPISDGEFVLNGTRMNDVAPSRRGIAMVFQSYALYPHMDVYENMAFGARLMGLDKAEVEQRIADAARMLRLDALLKRRPRRPVRVERCIDVSGRGLHIAQDAMRDCQTAAVVEVAGGLIGQPGEDFHSAL